MATIERIEQDIKALEEKVSGIAQSLQDSYTTYFTALGQAVRQQLILATYHLCTQGYPHPFLRLSLSQRQKLQQSIRDLGTKTAEQLLKYTKVETEPVSNVTEVSAQDTAQEQIGDDKQADEKENKSEMSSEAIPLSFIELLASEAPPFEIEELDELQEYQYEDEDEDEEFEDEDEETSNSEENSEPKPEKKPVNTKGMPQLPNIPIFPLINPEPLRFTDINTANPIEISKWVQSLEISTQFALKKLSREANLLLQKAEILPKKLPEPIIEAAASEGADVIPGPPNVLSVVVEVPNERQPTNSGVTQIMALNLRLTEIEFADVQVSSFRKQIRILQGQLQKLRRDYFKKQRELAIAQAEAAWRASWFDES